MGRALRFDGDTLTWEGRTARAGEVVGFHERFDTWTGRAWLEVRGPGWSVPMADGYGAVRSDLRRWFPDRPFDADWSAGRFAPAPLGMPGDAVFLAAGCAVVAAAAAAASAGGPSWGLAVGAACAWPAVRLRDSVVVRSQGLTVGPPWAGAVPWHSVRSVQFARSGRGVRVWARTEAGATSATTPLVLLPALRARLRRVGGIELVERDPDLDLAYERWRGPAWAIPWVLLLGSAGWAVVSPEPIRALTAGLLATAATAALGAAVHARATGWGAGGVAWGAVVYAVVLAAVAVGLRG